MKMAAQILLNGLSEDLDEALSVAALIARTKEQDVHLIVEVNGRYVYPRDYDNTIVQDGDRVEFINPNFGG